MNIREETPLDIAAIRSIVTGAFETAPHSSGREAAIVDELRNSNALALSLVADCGDEIVGHIAFSPVVIDGEEKAWLGLGPIAVATHMQRQGIGGALIAEGVQRVTASGARGCVVLGDPAYYGRFGFEADPKLRFPGVPANYFQRLMLQAPAPTGVVKYHPAFY